MSILYASILPFFSQRSVNKGLHVSSQLDFEFVFNYDVIDQ